MSTKRATSNIPNFVTKETGKNVSKKTPRKEVDDTRCRVLKQDKQSGKTISNSDSKAKYQVNAKQMRTPRDLYTPVKEQSPRDLSRPINTFRVTKKNTGLSSHQVQTKKPVANFIEENIRLAGTFKPRNKFKNRADYVKNLRNPTDESLSKTDLKKDGAEKENSHSKITKLVESLNSEVNFPGAVEKASNENIVKVNNRPRVLREKSLSSVNSLQNVTELLRKQAYISSSAESDENNGVVMEETSSSSDLDIQKTSSAKLRTPVTESVPTTNTKDEESSEYVIGCSFPYTSGATVASKQNHNLPSMTLKHDDLELSYINNEDDDHLRLDVDNSDSAIQAYAEPESEDDEVIEKFDKYLNLMGATKDLSIIQSKQEKYQNTSSVLENKIELLPVISGETTGFKGSAKSTDDLPTTDHNHSIYESTEFDGTTVVDDSVNQVSIDENRISRSKAACNFPLHIRVNVQTDPPSKNVLDKTVVNYCIQSEVDATYMMAPASSSHFHTEEERDTSTKEKNYPESGKTSWKDDEYREDDQVRVMCPDCAAREESSPYCMCSSRADYLMSGVDESRPATTYAYMVSPEYQNLQDMIINEVGLPDQEEKKPWAIRYQSGGSTWQQEGDWVTTAKLLQELSQDLEDCQYQADRAERQVKRLSKSFTKRRRRRLSKSSSAYTTSSAEDEEEDYFSIASSEENSDSSDSYVDSSTVFSPIESANGNKNNKMCHL